MIQTLSPSLAAQTEAWQRYVDAKEKSEQSLALEDGRAAAEAWVGFLNAFLPDDERLPEQRTRSGNVTRFPVHKTRTPGGPL